ncbi:hypothetical protein PC128_g23978 [Phytophthora cactorum]|nr:hypothetical protein PC128_g23978 [Phytophthora cactorum]
MVRGSRLPRPAPSDCGGNRPGDSSGENGYFFVPELQDIDNPSNTPNAGFNPFFSTHGGGGSQGVAASTPSWNAQGVNTPQVSWPGPVAAVGGVPPTALQPVLVASS